MYYCSDCSEPICSDCALFQHKGHRIEKLSIQFNKNFEILKIEEEALKKRQEELLELSSFLESEVSQLYKNKEEIKEEMNKVMKIMKSNLKNEIENRTSDIKHKSPSEFVLSSSLFIQKLQNVHKNSILEYYKPINTELVSELVPPYETRLLRLKNFLSTQLFINRVSFYGMTWEIKCGIDEADNCFINLKLLESYSEGKYFYIGDRDHNEEELIDLEQEENNSTSSSTTITNSSSSSISSSNLSEVENIYIDPNILKRSLYNLNYSPEMKITDDIEEPSPPPPPSSSSAADSPPSTSSTHSTSSSLSNSGINNNPNININSQPNPLRDKAESIDIDQNRQESQENCTTETNNNQICIDNNNSLKNEQDNILIVNNNENNESLKTSTATIEFNNDNSNCSIESNINNNNNISESSDR
eukprot:gene5835-7262_t